MKSQGIGLLFLLLWSMESGIDAIQISKNQYGQVGNEAVSESSLDISAFDYSQIYYWREQPKGDISTKTESNNNGDDSDSISGDRLALMDLYEATGGDSWTNNSGWGDGYPSNNWYGVEVNDEGRVVRLYLSDNNLSGSLPESIGNLQQLRYINLKQNRLTGEIPASIGNWKQIKILYLSGRYAEDLPDNPQRVYHLGKNDESSNDFIGVFPDVYANYPNLEEIQVSGSSLTHLLYDSIENCKQLRYIVMGWNELNTQQIPSTISNLSNLQWFLMARNSMTGSLPSFRNAKDLRHLTVSSNGLSGELPDFSHNTLLREIILDSQHRKNGGFTGDWPHYWNNGEFTNLIGIRATFSEFTGTLHGFENLDLKTFALDGNNLEGEIPESITTNDELIILSLGWNNFSGQIPQSGWGAHENTRYIRFAHNNLEGPIPDELPNSSDLQYLYFEGNELSGEISTNHGKYADSGAYPKFNYMDISGNDFNASDYQALEDELGSKLHH